MTASLVVQSVSDIVWVAILGGASTYACRVIPLLLASRRGRGDGASEGPSGNRGGKRFLSGIGPAAITALLALSLLDLVPVPERGEWAAVVSSPTVLATMGGIIAVAAAYVLRAGIVVATVAGTLACGVLTAILGG